MKLELFKGLKWSVRLVASNGEILMTSETYWQKSNAVRARKRLSDELKLRFHYTESA